MKLHLTSSRKSRSTRPSKKAAKPEPTPLTEACTGEPIPEPETVAAVVESLPNEVLAAAASQVAKSAGMTATVSDDSKAKAPKGALELLARAESIEGPISPKTGKVNQLRLRVDGGIRWAWYEPVADRVHEVSRDAKTVKFERVAAQA
jgi:hypothetical protein